MRARPEIEHDHKGFDYLSLEVLLDIRDLLKPEKTKRKRRTKKEMAKASGK